MRDHLIRRARGQKAEVVAAGHFMVRSQPFDLVGIARPHIDFLIAEHQRGPFRFAVAGIEYLDLHAENLSVPLRCPRDIGDIDHDMIESADLYLHGLSSSSRVYAYFSRWSPGAMIVTTLDSLDSTASLQQQRKWRRMSLRSQRAAI